MGQDPLRRACMVSADELVEMSPPGRGEEGGGGGGGGGEEEGGITTTIPSDDIGGVRCGGGDCAGHCACRGGFRDVMVGHGGGRQAAAHLSR